MKKQILILIVMLMVSVCSARVFGEDTVNAIYGETYMCGDACTVSIMTQPQMMARIDEKLNYLIELRDPATGRWTDYQIAAVYGKNTDEDVLLNFRVSFRNLNGSTLKGLSRESFILTGKVRDRVIEFRPEVMMPFAMSDDDWEIPMIRAGVPAWTQRRGVSNIISYDIADYWNPLLMEEKNIESMYVKEIRLVYRVPSFLVGWELHVAPQPADGNTEGLRSCALSLALPTVMNEITRETYKYIY